MMTSSAGWSENTLLYPETEVSMVFSMPMRSASLVTQHVGAVHDDKGLLRGLRGR